MDQKKHFVKSQPLQGENTQQTRNKKKNRPSDKGH
jgi:hypothetical protein